MTNKELRAKIYAWLYDCYKINVRDKDSHEKRKKLKNILVEYSPTQLPAPKTSKTPKVVPQKKEYLDTKGRIKVWRNF